MHEAGSIYLGDQKVSVTRLPLTPLLKTAMHRFVVGIALGEEMPLGAGIEDPEHRFQNHSGRDGFPPRTGIRNMFFGKMFANPVPLVIAQPQHDGTYRDECPSRQLF